MAALNDAGLGPHIVIEIETEGDNKYISYHPQKLSYVCLQTYCFILILANVPESILSFSILTMHTFPYKLDKVTISISPTTTSLTVSWMLEQSLTASTYTISYQRTDSSCAITISDISGSDTTYTLTDLEEGTEYSVTLTATFTEGQGTGKDNLTHSTTDAG